jgi:hypothetical protein
MQNMDNTLKGLEDDVAELRALVKVLDRQERELRKRVIMLDSSNAIPLTETTSQEN